MSRVDLHLHSTASDGKLSPEALVRRAAALGLTAIALTDHDTIAGLAAALKAAEGFPQLRLIPGVEVSTDMPGGEAHVLGYFIDATSRELQAALEGFRSSRLRRAQGMIARLSELGVAIDWGRVQEIAAGGAIGRPHLAQAMLEKGYISSFKQAFTDYIGRGGPAYVEREKVTPAGAVALIVRSGGLPVLAHPFTVTDPEALVAELQAAGLVGIEAYYAGYTPEQTMRLVALAESRRLIATGGSDYHGLGDSGETVPGGVEVPLASAESLFALAEERGLKTAGR